MANGDTTTQFLATLQESVSQVSQSFLGSIPAVQQATQTVTDFGNSVQAAHNTATQITAPLSFLAENHRQITNAVRTAAAQVAVHASGQKIAAGASRVWTTAQTALNNAFRANPIGFIVTVLQYLIMAIITAYQNSETFRNIVHAAFEAIKNVAMTVFEAIKNAVMTVWPFIQTIIEFVVNAIKTYVVTYFTIVRTIVTTVFNAIQTIATRVWNGIKTVITGAVNTVVAVIGRIQRVYTVISDAFNRARTAVTSAISTVVSTVRGLPGRAVSALGNIGNTLLSKGEDLIRGFINGIESMASSIVDTIKSFVIDKIPGPIKSALGISSPSKLMEGIGRQIGEGLARGIEGSGRRVARAMSRLVPLPTPGVAHAATSRLARATLGHGLADAAFAADGRGVTVNVYPSPGKSEYEIGRIAARELAWAAKR